MSVLIKGMKMPTSCNTCPMFEGDGLDGLCHAASRWLDDEYWRWYLYPEGDVDDSRPLNCPLVEVPVPHGRLIDADKTLDRAWQNFYKHEDEQEKKDSSYLPIHRLYDQSGFECCQQTIVNAPTVIEAEEGEAAMREGGNHETTD